MSKGNVKIFVEDDKGFRLACISDDRFTLTTEENIYLLRETGEDLIVERSDVMA